MSQRVPDRILLVGAILALTTAASLVGFLEYKSDERQRSQNRVIVQQVCERTATVVAGRIRHLLDIAVLETIEGIGHAKITDEDLPRVAKAFANGLKRHAYVDQFFLWSADRTTQVRDQAVFYSPVDYPGDGGKTVITSDGPLGSFVQEPDLGREILRLARSVSGPRTFVVVDRSVNGIPYEFVIHMLWRDDRRVELFSVIGYIVNLHKVDSAFLHRLLDTEIQPFLHPDPNAPRLAVAMFDDSHHLVYGNPTLEGVPASTVPVEMVFFPGEPLTPWLAGKLAPRTWQLVVSTEGSMAVSRLFDGWVGGAVVLLILIAALCGLAIDAQTRRLSKMQADFVSNVSHQLKTPLSLLSAAIETLCLGRVPPERLTQYSTSCRPRRRE